ncbi:Defensin-like protein 268 [Arabidopsis thaliana]|uniref:Defensin-like protein 268 n=4 Tax=Arabidopsis TaxID=3701 RepID=DF268_ARATH|nr:defensin-like protein [Arabidopsis thaliana]Q2V4N6.1 RecName: Full=Defensin-like protein 268; Flags: Precursor [Arabidopsis thaliana]KAG7596919.1 hypothetical protein ISN44_As06g013390 [Arabidopsis suecica]KAG7646192.1 hypothetical protein ISN45_At01g013640 [Arabidopsis thaliana x Arabidopsis arenosa]ABI34008.1 unknown [Arabidopsis thaliana]AEE29041.1 defensin-like protein [Arabidopsis thaliana]OAP16286.1 hypothetical protein AXX17_AT1G14090 [Arabidopsis thaliana]|eukprot:NP_001031038.1 defensin-like protein [Arabidopsis thaliana]
MARLIFHFVFALILAAYLLSVTDAIPRGWQEPCFCPSKNPYCDCGDDLQVPTTSVISPKPIIEQCARCERNSQCNKVCPATCKYKVCIFNRTCEFSTCHCYRC